MNRFSLFCVLCFFLVESIAQNHPVLSQKHLDKINNHSSISRKLSLYRKFSKKDSIRHIKQANRYWKAQTGSLTKAMVAREKALAKRSKKVKDGINSKIYILVYKPWAKREATRYLNLFDKSGFKASSSFRIILKNYLEDYFLKATQNDSILYALKQQIPDLQLPKQLASKVNLYKAINVGDLQQAKNKLDGINPINKKAQRYAGKYGKYKNAFSNATQKGFVKTKGTKLATQYASQKNGASELNEVKGHLGEAEKLKGFPDEYRDKMNQLQDSAYIKEQAKKKAEELAMQYIEQHPEIMQGAQSKMRLLMKTYSVVPNSNDLSTATKRTSLKGKTFFERLQIAANFQVISLKPIAIDFAPQVGYKFNSKFVVGIGGLYRKTFGDSLRSISSDAFGYKAFTTYEVLGKFFVNGEFGRNSPGLKNTEGNSQRAWEKTLVFGVGRKMLIHPKIEMTLMVGYNFMHQNGDTVYPKPWAIRVGFQTSELAFLNKSKLHANNLKGRF